MESTKEASAINKPGSSRNMLLSNQDPSPPIFGSRNQDTSEHSPIRVPTTKQPLTATTSIGTKKADTTSAESKTQSVDQEQQPKSPTTSGKKSKDTSDKTSQLLSEDPFGSAQSKALFDAIDQLRICGAGQDLDLPQLVIVGQQSAGKSSLLQSLTDIPFTIGGGLCTRFATRIMSRRTEPGTSPMIHVSIGSDETNPFEYEKNKGPVESFDRVLTSITSEVFEEIVKDANRYMGILQGPEHAKKNFSNQVLKIELSGPNRSHFGILDIPGVFSNPMDGITPEEMAGVTKMVTSYMKERQNIIICVAPANGDLSHQTILNLITSEGIDKSRVVGVFTKVDRANYEEAIRTVRTVRNKKSITLQNGWFVVQNCGPESASRLNREQAEKTTLSKPPWVDIPEQQRGTSKLKVFLANILCRRIRESFPGLRKKIAELLAKEKDNLIKLGNDRTDPAKQREYLLSLVASYQELAQYALKSPEELASNEMKLRGMVRHAAESFANEMRQNGNFFEFLEIDDGTNKADVTLKSSRRSRTVSTPDDKKAGLYNEIRTQIHENEGEELSSMSNPAVLKPLFRKQTSKWQTLGQAHLKSIVEMSEVVAARILTEVCENFKAPVHTKNDLRDLIAAFKEQAESEATERLRTLCHEITTFPLQTTNEQFLQKVTKAQHARFRGALERYRKINPPGNFLLKLMASSDPDNLKTIPQVFGSWAIVDLTNIDDLFDQMHPRGVQNTEDEIHDLLKAYYEIALEDFLSHIQNRIVEPFLRDKRGPVLGFSTEYILGISVERIEMLGSEDKRAIADRKETLEKIERLEEAMRIADQTWRRTKELEG
ncbi:P-loop containing nucleoside triphosphate hydrolase protein [Stipitochalara longipes BDJ]|nr:P-loop containing nucleoside triphosphate hydrolase protein [Stipitochalara longipes BDJ]